MFAIMLQPVGAVVVAKEGLEMVESEMDLSLDG